jgi:transcription elongation factor GreA
VAVGEEPGLNWPTGAFNVGMNAMFAHDEQGNYGSRSMEDVRPEKEVLLTPEGLAKLKAEAEQLRTTGRRQVAQRISEALQTGGELSENQEYLDAKEEQARLEQRLALLEERLANARVIRRTRKPPDVVGVGTKVRLKDMDANETVEYRIVGSAEADPAQQKLSNESPVGRAIIGRKKGETVEVAAPRGSLKYKILDIKAA